MRVGKKENLVSLCVTNILGCLIKQLTISLGTRSHSFSFKIKKVINWNPLTVYERTRGKIVLLHFDLLKIPGKFEVVTSLRPGESSHQTSWSLDACVEQSQEVEVGVWVLDRIVLTRSQVQTTLEVPIPPQGCRRLWPIYLKGKLIFTPNNNKFLVP